MPASTFPEYARELEEILNGVVAAGEATLISIQIDHRSSLRGFVSGSLQFSDASELHFREFVDTSLLEPKQTYAYHYQDANQNLIFRYDNARHRPQLSLAEHKHTSTGVKVAPPPTLTQVVDEIIQETRR